MKALTKCSHLFLSKIHLKMCISAKGITTNIPIDSVFQKKDKLFKIKLITSGEAQIKDKPFNLLSPRLCI